VAKVVGRENVTAIVVAVIVFMVTLLTPVNATAVAPRKLVPVMVTVLTIVALLVPEVGVKLAIVGAIEIGAPADTPAGVVIVIDPEVAPVGTFTVNEVSVAVEAGAALTVVVPTKFTAVAPSKFVPVMVIVAPTAALEGADIAPAGK